VRKLSLSPVTELLPFDNMPRLRSLTLVAVGGAPLLANIAKVSFPPFSLFCWWRPTSPSPFAVLSFSACLCLLFSPIVPFYFYFSFSSSLWDS
jgi:hypothetical protein